MTEGVKRTLRPWAIALIGALFATSVATASPGDEPEQLTVVEAPVILGTVQVGKVLTASVGSATGNPDSYTVSWRRGATVVGTGETYTPVAADVGGVIILTVTWIKEGWESLVVDSAPTAPVAAGAQAAFTPVISGVAAPGRTLAIASLPSTGTKSYRWYRNGKAISGATKSTFTVPSSYLGSKLTVQVTSKRTGYVTKSATSAAVTVGKAFKSTQAPVMSGTVKVGRLLKASTKSWSPAASFTYQWLRDGKAISGATKSSYYPVPADAGAKLSVRVTGKRSGYAVTTRTSTTRTVALGNVLHDDVRIVGTPRLNSVLAADVGYVLPATTTVTYQWARGGVAIPGANGPTYTVVAADENAKSLAVHVTYSAPGYTSDVGIGGLPVMWRHPKSMARPGYYSPSGAPGAVPVEAGSYSRPDNPGCVWSIDTNMDPSDGVVSSSESWPTRVLDLDASIDYFYTSGCGWTRYDQPYPEAPPGVPTLTPVGSVAVLTMSKPTISGTPRVGKVLTAVVPQMLPPADEPPEIAWYVGGEHVYTGKTYTPKASEAGQKIFIEVTSTRMAIDSLHAPGHLVMRSATTAAVSGPVFAASIAGTPAVGSTLTAQGVPSGFLKSYKWYRSGKAIAGATKSKYKLTAADYGKQVAVRITIWGYGRTFAATSSKTAVVKRGFTATQAPTITGTAVPGSVLTAKTGAWSPAATMKYQWIRDGVAIAGATSSKFVLADADAGAGVAVRVTGTRSGFLTTTRTSAAVKVADPGKVWAAQPKVTGTVRAGSTLTATAGAVSPAAATATYQWLRDGVAVNGATSKTYPLKNADIGSRMSVVVAHAAPGYEAVERASATTAKVAARPVAMSRWTWYSTTVGASKSAYVKAGTYYAQTNRSCDAGLPRPSGGVTYEFGRVYQTMKAGGLAFYTSGCSVWRLYDGTGTPTAKLYGDGDHVVGVDLLPGLYQREHGGGYCTVQFANTATHLEADIAESYFVEPGERIPVHANDKFVFTSECGSFERVGDLP